MAAAAAHMGRAEEHAPADARHGLRLARRVIIKVGTPVATHCDGSIALGRLGSLVEQISRLRQEGRDVVVVTSGAISTGSLRMRRNMTLQRSLQHSIQQKEESVPAAAAASVGQALLVNMCADPSPYPVGAP
jgi:glutamate 5-kinase